MPLRRSYSSSGWVARLVCNMLVANYRLQCRPTKQFFFRPLLALHKRRSLRGTESANLVYYQSPRRGHSQKQRSDKRKKPASISYSSGRRKKGIRASQFARSLPTSSQIYVRVLHNDAMLQADPQHPRVKNFHNHLPPSTTPRAPAQEQ